MGALTRSRFAGAVVVLAAALSVVVVAEEAPAALPGCAPAAHPGGDWATYGHDLANTRHQPAETEIGTFEAAMLAPAWTFSSSAAGGRGDFTGTPVVVDGCMYIASNAGWVFAANADTGAKVWTAKVPGSGGINSTVAVADGRVIVAVSRVQEGCIPGTCNGPYLVAFDQATGALSWTTEPIDRQAGADVYATPVVVDGVVIEGVSAGAAELGDEADRIAFQGSIVFVDAATGAILKKTWTIQAPADPVPSGEACEVSPPPNGCHAGGAVWSTPAVDPVAKRAYVGTGNPFRPQQEHDHTNAVIEFDVDRTSPTWGEITASYKGTVDQYVPGMSEMPCFDIPGNPPPYYPQGVGSCGDIDLDFGASPNLFTDSTGRALVGAGQKSGVYHAFDPAERDGEGNMQGVWSVIAGPPTPVGGIVGSTAYDGTSIYGPVTVPGYVWSVPKDGAVAPRWVSPTADGAHWGNPVASANGVIYTVDLKGFLDAYDARSGTPLLHRPLAAGSGTGFNPVVSWGGVSVARNTVYAAVGITGLPTGFVVAMRPSLENPGVPDDIPQPPPAPETPEVAAAIVAGPAAQFYNYATPAMVMPQGGRLTFTNADPILHDVDSPAWGDLPLIGLGESYEVPASELPPGEYAFYCSIHPQMSGTLAVV